MGKKAVLRGLLGFPLGVFIGYTVSIVSSLVWAKGFYSPAVPALVDQCGSEMGAVVLQYVLSGVLGSAGAAGSVIWERDDWSILKQTAVHFAVLSMFMLPIAYAARWMEHSIRGFAGYFGIFIAIYVVIWIVLYLVWRRRIMQLNDKLREANG